MMLRGNVIKEPRLILPDGTPTLLLAIRTWEHVQGMHASFFTRMAIARGTTLANGFADAKIGDAVFATGEWGQMSFPEGKTIPVFLIQSGEIIRPIAQTTKAKQD